MESSSLHFIDLQSIKSELENESEKDDFINTTYDISLDSRTSDRCSKRILSDVPFILDYEELFGLTVRP